MEPTQSLMLPSHSFSLSVLPSPPKDKTTHFQIDKNLSLRIHIKLLKTGLLFRGTLHHCNGLELRVSSKSWSMIVQFTQLKSSNLVLSYDFNQLTISLTSKISFFSTSRPSDNFLYQHAVNIFKRVKLFVIELYRYRIVNFGTRFCFSQHLQEARLKRQAFTLLQADPESLKLPKFVALGQVSDMVEEKDDVSQTDNEPKIQECHISQCQVDDVGQMPLNLLKGPKSLHFNFLNQNNSSMIVSGGFFEIQKLFCTRQRLQKTQLSKVQFKTLNFAVAIPHFPDQGKENFKNKEVLVRKTLKPAKKEHESNLLKLSKELIIVQQIQNKRHLLKYFRNLPKPKPVNGQFTSLISESTRGSMESEFEKSDEMEIQNASTQKPENLQMDEEIYMECHPHTLKEFIHKANRSLSETLDVCVQLLESVVDLHASGVIHRDIKPENVLIDYDSKVDKQVVKLIDFAESAIQTEATIDPGLMIGSRCAFEKIFDEFTSKLYGATLPYSPVECQNERGTRKAPGVNSFKIDSWSMGMILPEVYFGRRPANFSRPYAEDIISLIKETGLECHLGRRSGKGFGIGQSLIGFMCMKNLTTNQKLRMDVEQGYRSLRTVQTKFRKWQRRMRQKGQLGQFVYSGI